VFAVNIEQLLDLITLPGEEEEEPYLRKIQEMYVVTLSCLV
jgi:hypothetical protein